MRLYLKGDLVEWIRLWLPSEATPTSLGAAGTQFGDPDLRKSSQSLFFFPVWSFRSSGTML